MEPIPAQQAPDALENERVHAIVRVMEGSIDVCRRHQFFVWTQGGMQTLLPHRLAVCGVYERPRKAVKLEVFDSIVMPPDVVAALANGQSALMRSVIDAWIDHPGHAMTLRLADLANPATAPTVEALQSLGFAELLVHGVSRPGRRGEIETVFMFASQDQAVGRPQRVALELLLPHLHSTYLRVQSTERELAQPSAPARATRSGYAGASISAREEQVLSWIRAGLSNQAIGLQLGISPLTVKNHVQTILRKLGAANRAQAVARAMSMNLLTASDDAAAP